MVTSKRHLKAATIAIIIIISWLSMNFSNNFICKITLTLACE